MTSSTAAPAATDDDCSPADAGALADRLRSADPAVLLAVLAQVTGDTGVLDRYEGAISHVPDAPEMAGVTDHATAAAIVAELTVALAIGKAPGLAPDDPELFARLVPLALGWRPATSSCPCSSSREDSTRRSRCCRAPCRCLAPWTSQSSEVGSPESRLRWPRNGKVFRTKFSNATTSSAARGSSRRTPVSGSTLRRRTTRCPPS